MNESLQSLVGGDTLPIVAALILGLLTAISPCPLATNITAIGFISKDITNRRAVLWRGLLYTLGRTVAYTILAIVLILMLRGGASLFRLQRSLGNWGGYVIGPLLLVIGLFMLWGDKLHLPQFTPKLKNESVRGGWGALLLGVLFALAFCPSSAIFFFGGLIPLATASPIGWLLAVVFAVATAMPVLAVAFILAFSMNSIGTFYGHLQNVQRRLNIIVAILFIGIGIYSIVTSFLT